MNTADKTLEELEGRVWDEPELDSSLVTRCHALRKRRLRELSVEDLRLLVRQNLSLRWLVPFALGYLECDPWVEGHMGPGDLLVAVVESSQGFWLEPVNRDLKRRRWVVATKALELYEKLSDDTRELAQDSVGILRELVSSTR